MALQEDSKPVNDGAILFANSTDQDDPFQALAANTTKPASDAHPGTTNSPQTAEEGTTANPIAKESTSSVTAQTPTAENKAIAGDASALFGGGSSDDNAGVEALFGGPAPTADALFSNQPQQQQGTDSLFGQAQSEADPFFNGQYGNGTYQGYAYDSTNQQQHDQYSQQYDNQQQQQQQSYDQYYNYSQQYDQYGVQSNQQQQYDQYQAQQGQQQQQYDQYANYQYQDSYNNSYQQDTPNYYQHEQNPSYANYDPQQYGQYAGYQYGDQQVTSNQYAYDPQAGYQQQEDQAGAEPSNQYAYAYDQQQGATQYAYDPQTAYQPQYTQQPVDSQTTYDPQTGYDPQHHIEDTTQYTTDPHQTSQHQEGVQEPSSHGYTEQETAVDQQANLSQYPHEPKSVEQAESKNEDIQSVQVPELANDQLVPEEQNKHVQDEQSTELHAATEQAIIDTQNAQKGVNVEEHSCDAHNEDSKELILPTAVEVASDAVVPQDKATPPTVDAVSADYSPGSQQQQPSEQAATADPQTDAQMNVSEQYDNSYVPDQHASYDPAAYQSVDYPQQQANYYQSTHENVEDSRAQQDQQNAYDLNAYEVEDLQNEQQQPSHQVHQAAYEPATYQYDYKATYQPEQSTYDPSAYQAAEDPQSQQQQQQATYDPSTYKPVENLQTEPYQPYQDQSAYDANSYMAVEDLQKQSEYENQTQAVSQDHQGQYDQYSQYGYYGGYEQTGASQVPQSQQENVQLDPGFAQVPLQASPNGENIHGATRDLGEQSGDTHSDDQVVPTLAQSYDPYVYSMPPVHAGAPPSTNKPDEAAHPPPSAEAIARHHSPMEPAGRASMERSSTMHSTGSMLSRLASPALDQQLYPCPDPNCEGENKAKAKFCCECGRPLGSVSRAATPAIASVTSGTMPDTPASYDPMSTYGPPVTQPLQQQQQEMYLPEQTYAHEPATLVVDEGGGDTNGYYGGDMAAAQDIYDPLAQQQHLPPDPLNRARGCPIISFGFGGKFCVMFPQTVQRFTNHDGYETGAPITKTMPSVVKIKKLKDVLGEEDPMVRSLSQFVGPVLNDSKSSTKSKKKEALAYLDKRIAEMTEALGPASNGPEFTRAESRVLLWRLVKTLLETEGQINDTDKMDKAVRALLEPQEVTADDQGDFSVPAYAQSNDLARDEDAENIERSNKVLSKLQSYLIKGDREGAVDYAIQEDLWPHALILGSCINKDVWKRVVSSFVERELSATASDRSRQDRLNVHGDKQGLRVLYSLFAGSGATAMNEFLKLSGHGQRLNTPFAKTLPAQQREDDDDQLREWRITLTLILANRTSRDTEAITALGDILRAHGWLDAAHICYILSPQSSLHAGIDAPHVRLTLLGSEGNASPSNMDAYFLTELFEFAASLKQGGLPSLPFLQGYKLVHAWWLADLGYLSEAQRYCEAIASTIKGYTKGSPYLHRQLLESLREFGELCEATSGHGISGDTGSWLKNKLSKNSLDSLWGSLEGKFNKFVSGDDIPTEEPPPRKSTEIMGNPYDITMDGPPARSASAFDFRNGRASVGPEGMRRAATPTASMASEGYGNRRSSSPGARATSAYAHGFTPLSTSITEVSATASVTGATTTHENQAVVPAYGGYGYGARPTNATMSPFGQPDTSSYAPTQSYDSQANEQQQHGYTDGWYGSQQGQYEPAGMQQYEPSTAGYEPTGGGTMRYEPASITAAAPAAPATGYGDDDDDLGFGNSALTKTPAAKESGPSATAAAAESETQVPEKTQAEESKKESEHDEKKADEGKGWRIFSLFSRTPSSAHTAEKKAVKANLGQSSTFYYDEKEKRWVNKAAPSQPATPSLPPPPKATPKPSASAPPAGGAPPPPASVSPAVATTSNSPMMAGPPGPRSTTSPPPAAPPSGAARRPGSRKPMRSRYVDVFNQPGN